MKLNIATKLISGNLVMVFLLVILGGVSYININKMQKASNGIKFSADYDDAIMSTIINIIKQQDAITDYSLTGDDEVLAEISALDKTATKGFKTLLTFAVSKKEKDAIAVLKKAHRGFLDTGREMGAAFKEEKRSEGLRLMDTFDTKVSGLEKTMEAVETTVMAIADTNLRAAEEAASKAKSTIIIVSVLSIFVGLSLGIFLSRSISRPVIALAAATDKMAEGDLTQRVKISSSDETGDMAASFNAMGERLRDMMKNVRDSATSLAVASEQIAASSEELAAGVENQTMQTNEISSAIEELATSVQSTYENTKKSLDISKVTSEQAGTGGDIVSQAMAGMSKIDHAVAKSASSIGLLGDRSKEIGTIVNVIKEIASQTNLLALNAAIEANRAGEYGRGFEVVAEEIRKLAEKSAESTGQITNLVSEIQETTVQTVESMSMVTEEVDRGSALANDTGKALEKIIDHVAQTVGSIEMVTKTAQQQAAVSDQVAASMESISSTTRESSASAEEMSNTAQELARLGDELQNMTGKFTI